MITHPEGQTRSLCRGFFWAGTISPRRSRIKNWSARVLRRGLSLRTANQLIKLLGLG
jgi:hypothetical protein